MYTKNHRNVIAVLLHVQRLNHSSATTLSLNPMNLTLKIPIDHEFWHDPCAGGTHYYYKEEEEEEAKLPWIILQPWAS